MMGTEVVTTDLSQYGYRELRLATTLLDAYCKGCDFLYDGVTLNFNTNSGCVFLSDEDFNVAMVNGDNLEQWFNCPICGHEGFKEEMAHGKDNEECQAYLKETELIEA